MFYITANCDKGWDDDFWSHASALVRLGFRGNKKTKQYSRVVEDKDELSAILLEIEQWPTWTAKY